MRKLILFILLLCSFQGHSQTFATLLNNWRAYNNTNVTTKTAAHSITPQNVGAGIGDSLAYYILLLNSQIVPANGLQGTLNQGNTATTSGGGTASFSLQNGSQQFNAFSTELQVLDGSGNSVEVQSNKIESVDPSHNSSWYTPLIAKFFNTTGQITAQVGNVSGQGELWLRPTSTNVLSKIIPTSTSNETFSEPDKGGSGGTFAMTSDLIQFISQPHVSASYTNTLTPVSTTASPMSNITYDATAQATDLLIANLTGSLANKQIVEITIKDNGTIRNLTYGTLYVDGINPAITKATATVVGTTLTQEYEYNASAGKLFLQGQTTH